MKVVSVEPPKKLRGIVRHFWYSSFPNPDAFAKPYKILADGLPGIVFQHSTGNSSVLNSDGEPLPIAFLYGQKTTACTNLIRGTPTIIGVSFFPVAFKSLFNMNASDLTNDVLDIEHFFSRGFVDLLLNTADTEQTIGLFCDALYQQSSKQEQDAVIKQSVHHIIRNTANVNARDISAYSNTSRRQFQRRFKQCIGVAPETYIRIIKFQKAAQLLRNGHFQKLSDIAYALNYSDQSHFIREFKNFSGHTPKVFLRKGPDYRPVHMGNESSFCPLRLLEC
nr:AraC family transcriptional regulator [Allomuricauda sp.]